MAKDKKSNWVKTTPYGDYTSKEDNHKSTPNNEQYNLVRRCKKFGMKHAGSKSMHALRNHS